MKNFFTKAIVAAGVMASAMVLSSVCAFATDYTSSTLTGLSYSVETNGTTKTTTWEFAGNSDKTAINAGDTLEGILVTGTGTKSFSTDNKFSVSKDMGFSVPVDENSQGGTIAITATGSNADRYLILNYEDGGDNSGKKIVPYTKAENTLNFTTSDISEDYLKFTNNPKGGDYKISKIVLTETVGVATTSEYTVSVKDVFSGEAISGFTVKLGEETVSPSAGKYTFTTGNTYVFSADGYESKDVAVTAATASSFVVELTPVAADISEAGTYSLIDGVTAENDKDTVAAGFVYAGHLTEANTGTGSMKRKNDNGVYSIEIQKKGGSSIKFTTTETFEVTVPFTSTSGTNESDLAIKNASGADVSDVVTHKGSTISEASNVTVTLEPGTYYIYSPGNSDSTKGRGARLYSVTFAAVSDITIQNANSTEYASAVSYDGKYYAVAVISADDADDTTKSTVVLAAGGQELATTGTVYSAVEFDQEYTAESFGGAAGDYLYAAEVTGVGEATDAMDKINHIMVTVE